MTDGSGTEESATRTPRIAIATVAILLVVAAVPAGVAGAPGQTVTVAFEIDADRVPSDADELYLTASEPPAGWQGVGMEIDGVTWEYGTEQWQAIVNDLPTSGTIQVRVTYKAGDDAVTGDLEFGLRAIAGGESWTVRGSKHVSPDGSAWMDLDGRDAAAEQNETVPVAFNLTNRGTAGAVAGINITHVDDGLTVVGAESPSGRWQAARMTWFWLSEVEPGQSVSAMLLVTAADSGEYEIRATGSGGGSTDAAVATVTVQRQNTKTVAEAIAGDDGAVGFDDVLQAIEWYNTQEAVPNTGGETVSFQDVLDAIERYNQVRGGP